MNRISILAYRHHFLVSTLAAFVYSAAALPSTVTSVDHRLNPIEIENQKVGTDNWQLTRPARHREVEGYASAVSLNRGESIDFFVSAKATANDPQVQVEIYRMGWYGGLGARKMTIETESVPAHRQATPKADPATGLIDCDWKKSFSVNIPDSNPDEWISGHYLVKLTSSTGHQSYIPFVVRDDKRAAEIAVNSSVTTWQAYNNWPGDDKGGKSVYDYNSSKEQRAHQVSFNRPYGISPYQRQAAIGVGAGEFITNVQPNGETDPAGWEYAFVRFLESRGQDAKYVTDVDLHTHANTVLSNVKLFFSVGHDEYWSRPMREALEAFHARGGHVGILSSNTMYWQVRLGPEADNVRTMTVYKDTKLDPVKGEGATIEWREVGLPEQNFIGMQYEQDPAQPYRRNGGVRLTIDHKHWLLEGTHVKKGYVLRGAIGYEADRIFGATPDGVEIVGQTGYRNQRDHKTGIQHMTIRYAPEGGVIWAVGGMKFNNLLDGVLQNMHGSPTDPVAQQMVLNFIGLAKKTPADVLALAEAANVKPGRGPRLTRACEALFSSDLSSGSKF